ncbi:uncharacterized protein [Parasteatoda tepidariorum]|nr:pollen-specific leucine-rich repeat extensin-like protein 1 isoform X1 [Parasteatoda tepidariorum]
MKILVILAAISCCRAAVLIAARNPDDVGAAVTFNNQDGLGQYEFGYSEGHPSGASFRRESGDAYGNKVGSFGLRDADGRLRVVRYIADANGFRADVTSNEPGVAPADPASATINKPAIVPAPVVPVAPVVAAPAPFVPAPPPVIAAPPPPPPPPYYAAPVVAAPPPPPPPPAVYGPPAFRPLPPPPPPPQYNFVVPDPAPVAYPPPPPAVSYYNFPPPPPPPPKPVAAAPVFSLPPPPAPVFAPPAPIAKGFPPVAPAPLPPPPPPAYYNNLVQGKGYVGDIRGYPSFAPNYPMPPQFGYLGGKPSLGYGL